MCAASTASLGAPRAERAERPRAERPRSVPAQPPQAAANAQAAQAAADAKVVQEAQQFRQNVEQWRHHASAPMTGDDCRRCGALAADAHERRLADARSHASRAVAQFAHGMVPGVDKCSLQTKVSALTQQPTLIDDTGLHCSKQKQGQIAQGADAHVLTRALLQ